MELPQKSHVRLVAHAGDDWLQHGITKEKVKLPVLPAGAYSLHFDDDGDAYVSSGLPGEVTTEWASNYLSAVAVMDDSHACFVVKGDVVEALDTYCYKVCPDRVQGVHSWGYSCLQGLAVHA